MDYLSFNHSSRCSRSMSTQEVDRVLPNGTIPIFDHLVDLQIIEAILYESLRLCPPGPSFVREAIRTHGINTDDHQRQISIPADTHVLNGWAIKNCTKCFLFFS